MQKLDKHELPIFEAWVKKDFLTMKQIKKFKEHLTAEEEEKAVATAVAHVDRIRTARKTAHEVTVRELKHIKAEA